MQQVETVAEKRYLVDYIAIIAGHKKLVLSSAAAMTTLSIAAALLMSPVYTSKATIMPPQQQSSSVSSLLGSLGGLAGAAGNIAGLKNPNDLYVGMLDSRTLNDRIIDQFHLKEHFKVDTMVEARKILEKKRRIAAGKDGIIVIEVDDKDAKFAADVANRYVDELVNLTQTLAVTEASKRRMFFEKQLRKAKDDLAQAEVEMRKTQETTGMLQLSGQVQSLIAGAAQLRGMIAAKEVTLASLNTFATSQNPDVMRLQEEIRALRSQLANLENGQSGRDPMVVPAGKLPEVGVEYVRRARDVKYYETLFEMMAKQYELAKVDEAKDPSQIQQLDKAVPADKDTTSRRKYIVLAGLVGGLVIGALLALLRSGELFREGSAGSRFRALFGPKSGKATVTTD